MPQPNISLNWFAILITVLAAFAFGFLWYGPFFGKRWAKLMGMSMPKKPLSPASKDMMRRAFAVQLIGTFLTVFVLAHSSQVWRPSVWGGGPDGSSFIYGFYAGFFTWVGFYIPMQASKVVWEKRSWRLFFLNTAHDFLSLQLIAQILAHWK